MQWFWGSGTRPLTLSQRVDAGESRIRILYLNLNHFPEAEQIIGFRDEFTRWRRHAVFAQTAKLLHLLGHQQVGLSYCSPVKMSGWTVM